MSWNAKDHKPRKQDGAHTTPPSTRVFHDDEPLPTVAEAMGWDEAYDEQALPQRWNMQQRRELESMGMIDDRTWQAWARMCRNGREEVR